ncbi:hypothetical protein Ahy_A08g041076 isoform C [Arachis hypogaea]|uniref:Uncharacterized protein n=1 Tax=Arachis hypogaea TaxID=3818 RepID=A0A445C1J8_ARAHY|nr:hypothetical protein Ahy_A08g041076 isoform C [Arachis hypogaea]
MSIVQSEKSYTVSRSAMIILQSFCTFFTRFQAHNFIKDEIMKPQLNPHQLHLIRNLHLSNNHWCVFLSLYTSSPT